MKIIVFYGRRQVGMVVLAHLLALGHTVKVIPEDDLIRQMCKYYNLEIVTLDTMGSFDLFICCHGAKIIPEAYLRPKKFVNIHSCLWKYKGVNPIKRYIENKDTEASVESHFMVPEVDAGQVIARILFQTPIIADYGQFFNLAIPYYFRCIDETLKAIDKETEETVVIEKLKDRAVFTSVKKDKYFPLWIKYYSRFFEDIYVIDNEPNVTDIYLQQASDAEFKFTIINDDNPEYNLERWNRVIREQQVKLLEDYKWVLYTDADEIIVPDPDKYKNLGDYIDQCDKEYVFCTGVNVLQMYNEPDATESDEPALNITQPILKQRKYGWYESGWNKPLLSRIPLAWQHGMHNIKDMPSDVLTTLNDPKLILFHLKQADWEIHATRIAGSLSNEKGPEWFYKGHDQKQLIPERFKNSF